MRKSEAFFFSFFFFFGGGVGSREGGRGGVRVDVKK